MSSEDRRIVILEFDNSKFDKNVEHSRETLDKLKTDLKFEGAINGLDKLSASAKSFSLSGIGESIGTVTTKFSALEIIGKRVLENLTDSAMRFGSNLINSVVEPIKTKGWQRALNLEQANFMLEGLLGNAENGAQKIEEIMDAVQKSVKGTAYGMDEAAKVASQLVASGVQDGDQMLTMLRAVAGTAAMTGGSFGDLGDIFTTVAGNGRLMTEQLRQFSHRGLNVAAELAKQLNVTEAEIRDMVTKGQIDFMTFADAMSKAFGDHATKANETFTGSLANMRAALARIGADVATPALKNLRDIFNALRPLIDAVHEALKPFINTLNIDLTNATENTVKSLNWLTEKVKKFVGDVEKESDATEEAAESITANSEAIEQAARDVLAGKYGNGEERRRALEELGLSYELVQNRVNELVGCDYRYEVQLENTTNAIKKRTNVFSDTRDKIDSVREAYDKLEAEYRKKARNNFFAGIRKIIVALGQYGGIIKSSFESVFTGSLSKKIYEIAYRFRKFTDTLKLNEKQSEGLKRIFTGLFTVLKTVSDVVGFLVDKFLSLVGFVGNLIGKFLEFVGSVGSLDEAIEKLVERFSTLKPLQSIISNLSGKFGEFKTRVGQALQEIQKTKGFQHLQKTFGNLWETIKGITKDFGEKFLSKFEKFSNSAPNFTWVDTIVENIGTAADKLATFVDELLKGEGPVVDFFRSFSGKIVSGFSDFLDLLRIAKDNVVEFFSSFNFSESFNKFVTKLQNVNLSNIGQTISDFINSILESLSDIQEGDSNSLVTRIEEFFASLKEKFNKIQEDISNIDWDDIKKKAEKAVLVIGACGALFLTVRTLLTGIKFFRSLSNLMDSASGAFDKITGRKTLADKIPGIIDSVTKLVVAIAGSIAVLSIIDDDTRTKAVEDLLVMVGGIAAIFAVLGGIKIIDGEKIKQIGQAFQGMGIGVALLVASVVVMGHVGWETALKGIGYVGLILGELALAARIAGADKGKSAAAFMGLALAVDLLLPAILILGSRDITKAGQGVLVVGLIVGELALAARIAGHVKAAAAFLALAVAVDLLVPAIVILGILPLSTLLQGAITVGAIILAIAGAAKLAGSADWKPLVAMALQIGLVVAGIIILADKPWQNILAAAGAISAVVLSLGVAAALAGKTSWVNLLLMTVPLATAIIGLMVLADKPWENLLAAAASLALVFLSISGAIAILSAVPFPLGLGAIVLFDAFIVALVFVIAKIGEYFGEGGKYAGMIEKAIPVLEDLGEAIGKFIGELIENIGESIATTLERFGEAIGKFGESIEPFVTSVSNIDDDTASKLKTLATALLEISAAELLDQLAQLLGGEGVLVTFGEQLATFGTKIGEFITNTSGEGLDNAIAAVEKCAGIWPMLEENGIGGNRLSQWWNGDPLGKLGTQLSNFANAIKELPAVDITNIESIEAAVGPATNAFKTVVDAGVKGGLMGSVVFQGNPMKHMGQELKKFSENVDGLKKVPDKEVFESIEAAVGPATEAFKTVTKSGIKGGLMGSVVFQGNPMKHMGEELKKFSENVDGLKKVPDKEVFKSIEDAAGPAIKAFKTITDNGVKGGFFGAVIQGNPMKHLGKELKSFSENVQDIKWVNSENVKSLAEAADAAAPLFASVKSAGVTGGWSAFWEGSPFKNLGSELKLFAQQVEGIDPDIDTSGVSKLTEVMPEAIRIVRNASKITIDEINIEKFFDALVTIRSELTKFSLLSSMINTVKLNAVTNIVPKLIDMTTQMSNATTTNVEEYGKVLETIGEKIKSFNESVSGTSAADIRDVASSVSQLISVVDEISHTGINTISGYFKSSISTITTSAVDSMATVLETGSAKVSTAAEAIASQASTKLEKVVPDFTNISNNASSSFVKGLRDAQNAVSAESKALHDLAVNGVSETARLMGDHGTLSGNAFALGIGSKASLVGSNSALLNQEAVNGVSDVARTLGDYGTDAGSSFANGIASATGDAYNSGYDLANSAASGASSGVSYDTFYSIGSNSAQGMINGLNSKYEELYWTAWNMGSAAASAASAALDVNSPSRVMYSIGEYAIEGFVNAFGDGARTVFEAGNDMADMALKALTKPVEAIQRLLETDLDFTPTITPVIDLSNLENGTIAANGMLSGLGGQLFADSLNIGTIGAQSADTGAAQYDKMLDILSKMAEDDGPSTINNTFNITGENPQEIADEISRIIQKQVERREAIWA